MSPSLDANAYPHIFDLILQYAPRSALLSLRGVCSSLRNTVDALLSEHMVITSTDMVARHGRVPALSPYCFREEGEARLLAHARVADILGQLSLPESKIAQLNSALRLETVRLRHHPGGKVSSVCPLVARTLVTFTTCIEVGAAWRHPAWAETGPVPDGVERFVLNLRYDPGRSWMPQAHIPPFPRPKSLKQVVILFTEKTTHQEEEVWFRRANKTMGILNPIVLGMAMGVCRGVEYTLVDVETLRPEWLGNDAEGRPTTRDGPRAMEDAVVKAVEAACLRWEQCDPDTAREKAAMVRCLGRDEYKALVGEEQFALETIE